MTDHPVVSREQWLEARRALLAQEKEFTRRKDALFQQIRDLPWVRVNKEYVFETEDGERSLADLFGSRSQLIVYHFMFGPEWTEGCKSCSLFADHYDPILIHLKQRDVAFVTVSRAPLESLLAYRSRMGWTFPWVSSLKNDFNWDFQVSFTPEQVEEGVAAYNYGSLQAFHLDELPGMSVFRKGDDGGVFHTYSTYARGLDGFLGVYRFLDIVPKGRDEHGLPFGMAWVRHHDRYEDEA